MIITKNTTYVLLSNKHLLFNQLSFLNFASFYDSSIRYWDCFDSAVFFVYNGITTYNSKGQC